jgi:hypothetical protein
MKVFNEIQRMDQWWMRAILFVLWCFLLFVCYQLFIVKNPLWNVPGNERFGQITVLLLVLPTLFLLHLLKLTTKIDRHGIHYQFFPFHLKFRTVPWASMESCAIRQYNPIMEYGGWGLRWSPRNGTAFNVAGNKGIQIHLKTGKKILLGTQDPENAKKTLQFYKKEI